MTIPRRFPIVILMLIAQLCVAETLPVQLSNQEFWKLSSEFSEPDGTFQSDNLLSNETGFQYLITDLQQTVKQDAYVGVGPEQNFTYIAALKPKIAFIIDIRRGNMDLQLMYKALFELAADRADFVSLLFSRTRPAGLGPESTAQEIFDAYRDVQPGAALYQQNLKAIRDHLVNGRGLALSDGDLSGIEYVLHRFFEFGPKLDYNSTSGGTAYFGRPSTYAELMTAVDEQGRERSYLATEESFRFLKDLQSRNLIIPVVGNFSGPKAIRSVGRFLKERGAVVSEFYLSNVEQYLEAGNNWGSFCGNALSMPLDDSSTFIRAIPDTVGQAGLTLTTGRMLLDLTLGTVSCR